MIQENNHILPGSRVVVFDPRLFKNDKVTPLSVTMQPAVAVRRYGTRSKHFGIYPDLLDVQFDHDGRISRGHFTRGVKRV